MRSYLPRIVWVVVFGLLAVASLGFFVPPSIGMSLGLTIEQHILVVGFVELGVALSIAAIIVHYRDHDRNRGRENDDSEWRYDP
jgi:hypothetical protein